MKRQPDLLLVYIPWRLCEAYRQQGWDVLDLWPWHHGRYSTRSQQRDLR